VSSGYNLHIPISVINLLLKTKKH